MNDVGLSQTELARRVGVTQGAIAKIVNNNPNGSSVLHKIARELETTAEYLTGEIDDPDLNAPPPAPEPLTQVFMMPVVLPGEAALERMFLGLLRSMPGASEAELARGLATLLPTGLRTLQGQLRYEPMAAPDAGGDHDPVDAATNPERRRA